jgi:hypothetical protein
MGLRLAIALVLLAVAPAFAQDAPATLRPSVRADAPAPAAAKADPAQPAQVPATPPTPAISPIPPQPTAEQCRTRCAQDYYFCLAENEIQDCAPAWGQCRLACGTAATTPPVR